MFDSIPQHAADYLSAYPYKIELHAHTNPGSDCSRLAPKEIIRLLKAHNYDAVVITNHFFYDHGSYRDTEDPVATYLHAFYETKKEGAKHGIQVLLGAEYRFLESENDYLVYGVDEDLLRKTYHRSDLGLHAFYREFHSDQLLIIQAHPFRYDRTVADLDVLDGLEIMNMHPDKNSRSDLAIQFAKDHKVPIVTIGTDMHHSHHVGVSALRTKILPQNEKQLVDIIKSKDYIFEIGGHPVLPYFTFL